VSDTKKPRNPDPQWRDVEEGIHTDLAGKLTYSGYLDLPRLLSAQHPLSEPAHHDEMLFIIQHQTSELWFKLILHELTAAMDALRADHLDPCFKILARVKQVLQQLIGQWAVLETLTPSEYAEFRGTLGRASGFQSPQYRKLEFLLGNKNRELIKVFAHEPALHAELTAALESPSLYDEFLMYLHRQGFDLPAESLQRDWSRPYQPRDGVVAALRRVYEDTESYWPAYDMCEKLMDLEGQFQMWRFRHMKTVERIIGHKRGTGGSSGVAFLKRALDIQFFPELIQVRTELGTG